MSVNLQGTWTKDEEGFMEFETPQLQRLYEAVTDDYHRVYNRLLDDLDDEEAAFYQAREAGYEMITDYKTIAGKNEFVTTYKTPDYVVDVWYVMDVYSGKRLYHRGFSRIVGK